MVRAYLCLSGCKAATSDFILGSGVARINNNTRDYKLQRSARSKFTVLFEACPEPGAMAPEFISSNVMNFLVWRYLNEAGTPLTSPLAAPFC